MSEHDEQAALFTWAKIWSDRIPELELLFAIPNGQKCGAGISQMRKINTINKLKREGLKPGMPDLCLPVVAKYYRKEGKVDSILVNSILFVEMKYKKGKLSDDQNEKVDILWKAGHFVSIAYTWYEAAKTILFHIKHHLMDIYEGGDKSVLAEVEEVEQAINILEEMESKHGHPTI